MVEDLNRRDSSSEGLLKCLCCCSRSDYAMLEICSKSRWSENCSIKIGTLFCL